MALPVYDPFNRRNTPITKADLAVIFEGCGLKKYAVTHVSLFQKSFVHTTYVAKKQYINQVTGQEQILAPCPEGCMDLQPQSYEEFEFHGDRNLAAAVSKYLKDRFPDSEPRFLSTLYSRIVSNDHLAYLAKTIGLQKFMVISRTNEEKEGGRDNKRQLANIFEAFLHALWVDSGSDYELVNKFISNIIDLHVDVVSLIEFNTNFIDQFQRVAQGKWGWTPRYAEVHHEHTNSQHMYTFAVVGPDGKEYGRGVGTNTKEARQAAAQAALAYTPLQPPLPKNEF
jgi:ribonuclease-3